MKTYSKSLLIAVAALAVTATGAYAYSGDLTDEQRSALEQARELRQAGDFVGARDALLEAGFDESALKKLRRAQVMHNRHEAFLSDLEESLTPEQLDALQAAHAANDRATQAAILDEAGVEAPQWRFKHLNDRPTHDEFDDETEAEDEVDE
ncbi:hypothetical protein KC887_05635 [Candidatus Kaiserbacteria bacterium]|nr:hypothetical protein [Candidatus Kaiserbacteria bacterium]